jgi:hypothetical protein
VNPHSGNGVLGFVSYNGFCANCREYLRTSLTTPMTPGVTYSVSFWATNGYSTVCKYVSNNLGILFSKDSTWQSPANARINRTPQYNMSTVLDSSGWKRYSFTYIADSAYKYITIGNYYTDANTIIVSKTVLHRFMLTMS